MGTAFLPATRAYAFSSDSSNYEDGGDEDGDDEDTAQGEQERPVQRPRAEKMEPQIDEDGFETVVSRRRR